MAPKVRWLGLVLVAGWLAVLPVIAAGAAYVAFSKAAHWEIARRGLSVHDHNGLKHAYAGAEIYSLARIVLGPERAATAVVALGEGNEWIERVFPWMTDWSPEVYKDLRNNLTGILAAEWLYTEVGYTSPRTRLRLIGKLDAEGLLVAEFEDPRIPDLPRRLDTGEGTAKMREDHAALSAEIAAAIAAKGPALRADLGLD